MADETVVEDLAAWLTAIWDRQELIIGNEIDVLAEFYPKSKGWHWNYGWSRDVWRDNGEHGSSTAPGAPTPQEVLARIAADRKILALHSVVRMHIAFVGGETGDEWCDMCGSVDDRPIEWPCETIRLLASPYASRPGFRPEWSVERQGVEW